MTKTSPWIGSIALSAFVTLSFACGGGTSLAPKSMPKDGTWHGQWQSPQYGNLHLCQVNNVVMGDYEQDERRGTITGNMSGDLLLFSWEERRELVIGRPSITRGQGVFRIELGNDGSWYFRGKWGHDRSRTNGGPWNAVKLKRVEPTRCLRPSDGGLGVDGAPDEGVDPALEGVGATGDLS